MIDSTPQLIPADRLPLRSACWSPLVLALCALATQRVQA